MRGVLGKKIQREELETGDHIYTLRGADRKVHHGIYVNDRKVIHFCRGACSDDKCPTCGDFYDLTNSSMDCFLYGGDLYRFEYGVNPAHFLAKLGRGCTLASTDRAEDVKRRAYFIHKKCFRQNCSGAYLRYINNGEDFAMFCKTGLLVVDSINLNRSWQIAYSLAVTAAVFFSVGTLTLSLTGLAARFLGLYCICIFAPDLGARSNVIKIPKVRRLPQVEYILAYGGWGFQSFESYIENATIVVMLVLAFCIVARMWTEHHQFWFRIRSKLILALAFIMVFYRAALQRRLLSNKIQKEQLRLGDHIYTWRKGFIYAHHGIYIGGGNGREVIHLVRGEDPKLPSSSSPSLSHPSDSSTSTGDDGNQPTLPHYCHVEYCSIDRFVDGGELNLYKYGVKSAFFMAKTRGGTCTELHSYRPRVVVNHALFLQKHNRFGAYNFFNNNCEDFAIYCKTALLSQKDFFIIGSNGQAASFLAFVGAFFCLLSSINIANFITITRKAQIPCLFLTKNCTGFAYEFFFYHNMVTVFYIIYSGFRHCAAPEADLNGVAVQRLNS